jgi:hypothetical protein
MEIPMIFHKWGIHLPFSDKAAGSFRFSSSCDAKLASLELMF